MILIGLLWASLALSFPVWKAATAYVPAAYFVAFRMVIAGSLLTSYGFYKNRQKGATPSFSWKTIWLFCIAGFIHIYLAFVPSTWALQHIDSLKSNLLYAVTPFLSAFFSWMLLSERLSSRQWVGLFIGLLGLIPVLLTSSHGEPGQLISVLSISLPEIVLLISVVAGAYGWFRIKGLINLGYSIPFVNGSAMLIGGFMSLGHYLASAPVPELFPVSNVPMFLSLVSLNAFLSNIVFYNLYGYLLKRYSFTFLSFTGFLCPIFGVLFSCLLFGEPFYIQYAIGFSITFVGLWIFFQGQQIKSPQVKLEGI